MTQKVFCHCCRVHHPPEQMERFQTRMGPRWRCRRTIAAARGSIEARDAFGQAQTEANRAEARRMAERTNRLRAYPASRP